MAEWYYIESGQTRGPVDDEAIRVLASVGRLSVRVSADAGGLVAVVDAGRVRGAARAAAHADGRLRAPRASPPPPPPPGLRAAASRVRRAAARLRARRPRATARLRAYGQPIGADHGVRTDGVALVEARGRPDHRHVVLTVPLSILSRCPGWVRDARPSTVRRVFEMRRPRLRHLDRRRRSSTTRCSTAGRRDRPSARWHMRIQVRDIDTGGPIGFGRGLGRQLIIYVFALACVHPAAARLPLAVVGQEAPGVARQGRAQRGRRRRIAGDRGPACADRDRSVRSLT